MNYEVMGNVSKAQIVNEARRNPEYVQRWLSLRETQTANPYDFELDRRGVIGWYPAATDYTSRHPITIESPNSDVHFFKVIEQVLDEFQRFVEENRGWSLLWNTSTTEKPEEAVQLLFRGIVEHYCRANNINIDREVELGRGPVDFKFSNGYSRRALLEVKKLENTKFWNGLNSQLPSYMRSDNCVDGWFVAVGFRESKAGMEKISRLPSRIQELRNLYPKLRLRSRYISAIPKDSASKL
jgi:hypothetical protein